MFGLSTFVITATLTWNKINYALVMNYRMNETVDYLYISSIIDVGYINQCDIRNI